MGVMRGRGHRVDVAKIAEKLRPAVAAWFNARVQIIDPDLSTGADRFNPLADTGGVATPTVIFDSGDYGALIQPIRSPVAVQFGDQTTSILGIRFQVKPPQEKLALRAGLRIKVLDGGEAKEIENYTYTLNEGFNTSIRWNLILEASTLTTGVQ